MWWRDSQNDQGQWHGLELAVTRSDFGAGAPGLRFRARQRRLRLECAGAPVLWAHVHAQHQGVWLLGSDGAESLAVVPSVTWRDLARVDSEPGSTNWLRAWARHFAEALVRSPRTPLSPGRWAISAAHEPAARRGRVDRAPVMWSGLDAIEGLGECLTEPALRWESWMLCGSGAVVRLRAPSRADSGRVRALRKQARAGTLPPVLLGYASGLDMFVLLDGHDRLQAALLERRRPALLALWKVRRQQIEPNQERQAAIVREVERRRAGSGLRQRPLDTEAENHLLTSAFDNRDWLSATTPCWPLASVQAWEREVRERGVPRDHPLLSGRRPD